MPLPALSRIACCTLLCGAAAFAPQLSAWAQTEAPPDTADEALPAPTGRQPLSAPALEARAQALRQQLAAASDGEERYRLLDELARSYFRAGRVGDALRVRDEIIEDARILAGRRSLMASELALNQALIGDHPRSQRLVARAKQLARETRPEEVENLPREPSYNFLRAEAEIARRAHGRHEVALAKTRERSELAWANFNDPALSDKRRRAAANELLNNVHLHVVLLVQNNRRQEALSYVNEISWRLATRGELQATPFQAASIEVARGIALSSHDDYDGALEAINAGIARYQRAGAPVHEFGFGSALRQRLMVALAIGQIAERLADAEALQRGRALSPILAGSFPEAESDSLAMAARGQWAAATTRIGENMALIARNQGMESPFYKYKAAMQLLFRLSDPSGNVGLSDIERFVDGLASTDADWADASYRGAYVEDGALTAAMAWLMRQTDAAVAPRARALAFRIAELLRVNASQGALADGAARLAAGTPRLRALVEQEQVLRFDQATSRQAFALAAGRLERLSRQAETDPLVLQRQTSEAAEKEKTLKATADKLRQLRRDIAAQFPVYRELISPSIPGSERIGAVLRPGEAYVNLYAANQAAYAFVVLPGGEFHAQRLEVPRASLREMTNTLRRGFDAGVPPHQPNDAAGFDLQAAHGLYQALIAPIEPRLKGSGTVYLSTSGLLGSIPWNVLVTRPAQRLADTAWWIGTTTPVLMPSASALLLARTQAARRAGAPLLAFADPSFDGQEHAAAGAADQRRVRPPAVRSNTGTQSALDYRRIAPLPETLEEVRAIAALLEAPPRSVIRGTQASRSRVLKEDLSDARVVAFATHGLLPGEAPGLLKAGLALAYEGQGLADSLLTIDDVVGLRLNADWVVLSACNTGLVTGNAGDALSALSRGFFASGARALLATQWAVESESAKQLTVGLFKAFAADPALSKAGALARVQRDMLGGQYGALYRHPYFWGAYFLAGDAAR